MIRCCQVLHRAGFTCQAPAGQPRKRDQAVAHHIDAIHTWQLASQDHMCSVHSVCTKVVKKQQQPPYAQGDWLEACISEYRIAWFGDRFSYGGRNPTALRSNAHSPATMLYCVVLTLHTDVALLLVTGLMSHPSSLLTCAVSFLRIIDI